MAGYCTLVLYFHLPAARENVAAHSCNIQLYCLLTHQIYMYLYFIRYIHLYLLNNNSYIEKMHVWNDSKVFERIITRQDSHRTAA